MTRNIFVLFALVVATAPSATRPHTFGKNTARKSARRAKQKKKKNEEKKEKKEILKKYKQDEEERNLWFLHTLPKPPFVKNYKKCLTSGPAFSAFAISTAFITSLANPNNTTKIASQDAAIAFAGSYLSRYLSVIAKKMSDEDSQAAHNLRILGLAVFIISQNARDLYHLCSGHEDAAPKNLTQIQYQALKIILGVIRTVTVLIPPYLVGFPSEIMPPPKKTR